jgi:hypothetical protein
MYKIKDGLDLTKLLNCNFEDDIADFHKDYVGKRITFDEDEGYEGCCEIIRRIDDSKHISFHNYTYGDYIKTTNVFYLNEKINGKWIKSYANKNYIKDLIDLVYVVEVSSYSSPEIGNMEEITNSFFDKYATKEISLSPKQALKQLWDNSMHRDDMIGRNVEEANEEDLVLYNIILEALDKSE